MKPLFKRIFTSLFGQIVGGKAAPGNASQKLPLAQIQQALRDTLRDCDDVSCQRIGYKIDHAKTPADLWMLRSDLHQCYARLHSEQVAAALINDMSELFDGWLPASQLTRIQPGFRPSGK